MPQPSAERRTDRVVLDRLPRAVRRGRSRPASARHARRGRRRRRPPAVVAHALAERRADSAREALRTRSDLPGRSTRERGELREHRPRATSSNAGLSGCSALRGDQLVRAVLIPSDRAQMRAERPDRLQRRPQVSVVSFVQRVACPDRARGLCRARPRRIAGSRRRCRSSARAPCSSPSSIERGEAALGYRSPAASPSPRDVGRAAVARHACARSSRSTESLGAARRARRTSACPRVRIVRRPRTAPSRPRCAVRAAVLHAERPGERSADVVLLRDAMSMPLPPGRSVSR